MPALPELVKRLVLALLAVVVRVHVYPLAKIMGYRAFEPDKDMTLVTCCTNGLGHVHQMERVLTVLQEAGMRFPVIALAKEQKVPKYKLDALKQRFPDATFVNLNLEIDYDNGKSFNNLQITVWHKDGVPARDPFYRKVSKLFKSTAPLTVCPSGPSVAAFINVMNCPTKLVTIASQGQILRDNTGVEKMLIVRALEQLAVGRKGTLVPLSVRPMEGAIPQVVRLPDAAPPDTPRYFVAYSTVPQVLASLRTKLSGDTPVRLFVKERRLEYYVKKYRDVPHVEVRVTTPDFADQLAAPLG